MSSFLDLTRLSAALVVVLPRPVPSPAAALVCIGAVIALCTLLGGVTETKVSSGRRAQWGTNQAARPPIAVP